VQLVDHEVLAIELGPARDLVSACVHDARRTVDPLGLEPRARVRQGDVPIEHVAVVVTWSPRNMPLEDAAKLRCQTSTFELAARSRVRAAANPGV